MAIDTLSDPTLPDTDLPLQMLPKEGRLRERARRMLLPASGFVGLLIVWQIIGSFLNPIYISTPVLVSGAFGQLLAGPSAIWSDIGQSLSELYMGLALALVLGLVFGILVGQSKVFASATAPYLNFLNATPIVITLPLLTIWVGVGLPARIVFITLLSIWPVLLNVAAGCRNISGRYIELGQSLGFSRGRELRKIIIPGIVPYFLSGARVSCGLAVIGMVVAELEVSVTGMGYLLATFGSAFQTSKLLAVFILLSLFGMINVGILLFITRRAFPWAGVGRR